MAAYESGDSRVTDDGNHFALWNFQEPPSAYDHGSHGIHLVPVVNTADDDDAGIGGVIADGGFGRFADGGSSGLQAPKREILTNSLSGSNEWSLEFWFLVCLFITFLNYVNVSIASAASVSLRALRLPVIASPP